VAWLIPLAGGGSGRRTLVSDYNPIDRVRKREQAGPDVFDDNVETYSRNEVEQEQEAPLPPEPEEEADFRDRVQKKLNDATEKYRKSDSDKPRK